MLDSYTCTFTFSLIKYFRDDKEDTNEASMTHKMFDDQQVSTFVGLLDIEVNAYHNFPSCLVLLKLF